MQSQSPNQTKNNKRPKLLSMMGNQSDIHVQQDRLHNQNERLFTCVYTPTAVVACQESKRVIAYLLSLQIPFSGLCRSSLTTFIFREYPMIILQ
ncbi:hypothetical protein ACQJBY_009402 [Aegilops geniculata]